MVWQFNCQGKELGQLGLRAFLLADLEPGLLGAGCRRSVRGGHDGQAKPAERVGPGPGQ
jgi:hypothetical protein